MTVNLLNNGRMSPEMLTPADEAAYVAALRRRTKRVNKALISRARSNPQHPAHRRDDGTYTDPRCDTIRTKGSLSVRAPRDAVERYWASATPTPRRAAPRPPAGLTASRWRWLQALAANPDAPAPAAVRNRLHEAGLLAADRRTVTDAGHRLIAAHAPAQPAHQEQT